MKLVVVIIVFVIASHAMQQIRYLTRDEIKLTLLSMKHEKSLLSINTKSKLQKFYLEFFVQMIH